MKRTITLFTILLLCATSLFAQAPEKFSYQAVVRNASNSLVTDAQVGVRVSILQGSANGNAIYVETQTATTNANGLLTIEIGDGTVLQGIFADIDWANGPYFLKTETDPNGGSSYTVTSTQQLLSVPYALYSKEAGNGFSGDYNDLTNRPQIPQSVGELANDANYITLEQVPAQVNADWNATTGAAEILNKPTIPSVPTDVSAFVNDAGYITMDSVPTIPTNVSAFTNDASYITAADVPTMPQGTAVGDLLYWDGTAWVVVPAGQQGQQLVMDNGVPTWQTVEGNGFYYIQFDPNGGTGNMSVQLFPQNVAQAISSNMFVRNGFVFTGWNTAADGTGTSYSMDEVITLTENITLYAQWTTRVRVNLPTPCGDSVNSKATTH